MSVVGSIMDGMENKVSYTVYRDQVENHLDVKLTDREWEVFASDIESFIDYAIWQQMRDLHEELPQSIEDDEEFNSNLEK
jgi:hypothetical protein